MDMVNEIPLYRALGPNEIRLLVLLPGTKEAPIHCHLDHTLIHPIFSQPWRLQWQDPEMRFQALSYMWGPVEPKLAISIQEQEVPVRPNLWAALQAIRDEETPTRLWVDAICINQQDIPERNNQVAMMGKIYETAYDVLVWLGEATDDSDMLFDYLPTIPPARQKSVSGSMEIINIAFRALCSRPYWRRVWIIQEVFTASHILVLCGSRRVSWEALFKWLPESHVYHPLARSNASYFAHVSLSPPGFIIAGYRGYHPPHHTLPDLLQLCRLCRSESEDMRDRIYGLLGAALDNYGISPDYSKSTLYLYVTTAEACLNRGMNNMSLVKSLQSLLDDPFWDAVSGSFHGTSILDEEQLFQDNSSKRVVTMPMVTIAKVELMGPVMCESDLSTGHSFQWSESHREERLEDSSELTAEVQYQSIPTEFQLQHSKALHRAQELGGTYVSASQAGSKLGGKTTPFECIESPKNLGRSTGTFRFFKSNDGQLGIAPCGVAVGDIICCDNNQSQGFPLVVLRPKKTQGGGADGSAMFYLVGMVIVCEQKFPPCFEHPDMPLIFYWQMDVRTFLLLLR
ncbi:hypothetical protein VTL71DRAFT_5439 [Oculimacula yallundae]|uniref:Heterokaryon incompatibility domain-containing protein n=1 Tax=Oculimacula yallundae TaxID=86028 RepID=A0ABR4C2S1_9HELO